MKHLFTLLFVIMLASCAKELSSEEVAKKNIEGYLMQSLNDPESYEFVKISKLDTTYKKEHYQKMINKYQELFDSMSDYPAEIKEYEGYAEQFKKYGKDYDAEKNTKHAEKLQKLYDDAEEGLNKFKKLLNSSKEGEILEITTVFTCRAANKMGGKVLANYDVALTDSLTIKDIEQQ